MADTSTGYRFDKGSPRYALLEVRVDEAKLNAILAKLRGMGGNLNRLVPSAINKAADETRTWLGREFESYVSLARKRSIQDRLTVKQKASAGSWLAKLRISLSRLTVGSFADVQQTPSGVTWSTGGSMLKGGFIPRAFIRQGLTHYKTDKYQSTRLVFRRAMRGEKGFMTRGVNKAGHAVVATRAGDIVRRYPLKVLRGPSLGMVFSRDAGFQARAEQRGGAILTKKLEQQAGRIAAEFAT